VGFLSTPAAGGQLLIASFVVLFQELTGVRLPIVLFFILGALTFFPLGQIIGERLSRYRQHQKSLSGYAWDLGGSLAGVVSFAIVSYFGLFSIAWFAMIGALGSIPFFSRPKALAIYVLSLAVTLTLVVRSESAEFYSPLLLPQCQVAKRP